MLSKIARLWRLPMILGGIVLFLNLVFGLLLKFYLPDPTSVGGLPYVSPQRRGLEGLTADLWKIGLPLIVIGVLLALIDKRKLAKPQIRNGV